MAETPIYKRQINPQVQPQGLTLSTGSISNLEMVAKDASKMASNLQHDAEKIYFAQFESNARNQIFEISQRNKANPDQMAIELDAAYQGLSKNASPYLKDQLHFQYQTLSRAHISSAMELKNRIANDKLKETNLTLYNSSLRDLEKNAAMMLSSNSAVAYDASRAAQLQMVTIKKLLEQTDSDGLPIFTANQRVSAIEDANKQMVTIGIKNWFDEQPDKNGAMKAILSGQKKFKYYDQDGNLIQEKVTYDELDYHSFDKLKIYMESEVKHQFVQIAHTNQAKKIESFFNNNEYIDPKNKKQLKALNTDFNQNIVPQLASMNEDQKSKIIVDFIAKSHIVPEAVKGMIRTNTRSGTVAQQAWNANLVTKIKEINPDALNDFSDADITYANVVANKLRYGLTPQEAVESARFEFNPDKQDVIKLRKKDFNDVVKNQNIRADIRAALGETGFFNTTKFPDNKDITDVMSADYRNIYEQEYIRCGDAAIAKESANTIIRKTYGVTYINGRKEIMPYNPEKYYSLPNIDNKWMRRQLIDTIKSIDQYKNVGDDDIGVAIAPQTKYEISGNLKPSYYATIKTPQGYEVLRDSKGEIIYIEFDPDKELKKENELIEKRKKEKINSAEILRYQGKKIKEYLENKSDVFQSDDLNEDGFGE